MANSLKLHRVLTAPPERVYRAFTIPEAFAKWCPPHGFIAKVHSIEVRVGGSFKMSFTNFTTMNSHSFTGTYNEIIPNTLLKYTERFDNPALAGDMHTTIKLRKVNAGTELEITQEGIPDLIPVEMCYLGWQQSLLQLAQLVEPDIKDEA